MIGRKTTRWWRRMQRRRLRAKKEVGAPLGCEKSQTQRQQVSWTNSVVINFSTKEIQIVFWKIRTMWLSGCTIGFLPNSYFACRYIFLLNRSSLINLVWGKSSSFSTLPWFLNTFCGLSASSNKHEILVLRSRPMNRAARIVSIRKRVVTASPSPIVSHSLPGRIRIWKL